MLDLRDAAIGGDPYEKKGAAAICDKGDQNGG